MNGAHSYRISLPVFIEINRTGSNDLDSCTLVDEGRKLSRCPDLYCVAPNISFSPSNRFVTSSI